MGVYKHEMPVNIQVGSFSYRPITLNWNI